MHRLVTRVACFIFFGLLGIVVQANAAESEAEKYTPKRRILSRDADFENTASAIVVSAPLQAGLFSSWQPRGVSSETLVRRDAMADFGGQYLQFSVNGGIRQNVTLAPGTYPLLNLHVRLRSPRPSTVKNALSAERIISIFA